MASTSRKRAASPEAEDPWVRSVRDQAQATCVEIDEMHGEDAMNKLSALSAEWEVDNDINMEEMLKLAFKNFRWDEQEARNQPDLGLNRMLSMIQLKQAEVSTLMYTLKNLDMLEDDMTYTRIRQVTEKVYHAMRLCLSAVQCKMMDNTEFKVPKDVDEQLRLLSIRFRWTDGVDTSPIHILVWYILDIAFECGYRKHGSNIFEPIVTESGHKTHAYRYVCDIKAFVHRCCRKETNFEAHVNLLKSNAKQIVDHLENNVDLQLPFLNKDRSVFSFKQGIYTCRDDTFHAYPASIREDTVSANYFDTELDLSIMDMNWRDIPTPHIDKIFNDQKMTVDVRQWFFVFAGRMMWELNELDGWQIQPYLLGTAGSGKSTITDSLIGSIYDRTDVGVLSNNCERQWAVSGLVNGLIWICPEVKMDFQLEQATWQSMVSGERISVAAKYQTPYTIKWILPGWMSGNTLPGWEDHGGSIARRMIIFRFDERVTEHDTQLGAKIRSEMGKFIVKANRAYREMAALHGSKNIWNVLPEEFTEARDLSLASLSPVHLFFRSASVTVEEGAVHLLPEFLNVLNIWIQENNLPKFKARGSDALNLSIGKYGCKAGRAMVHYQGRLQLMDVITGCRLTNAAELTIIESQTVEWK